MLSTKVKQVHLMPPGAETAHLIPHSGSISALTTLDNQLVCGSEDGGIRLWDWVNGAVSALFSDQPAEIWALASLRQHGRLAAGFNDGVIRLIDVDGGDYYIWEAIESYHPRLVVIEYNSALDTTRPPRSAANRRCVGSQRVLRRVARRAGGAGRT